MFKARPTYLVHGHQDIIMEVKASLCKGYIFKYFSNDFSLRYATIYTMFPVFSLVLDQDVKPEMALLYPELYKDLTKVRVFKTGPCGRHSFFPFFSFPPLGPMFIPFIKFVHHLIVKKFFKQFTKRVATSRAKYYSDKLTLYTSCLEHWAVSSY